MSLKCGRKEICLSCEYYLEGSSDIAQEIACTIVGELVNVPDFVLQNEGVVAKKVAEVTMNPQNSGYIRGFELLPAVVESLVEYGKQPVRI